MPPYALAAGRWTLLLLTPLLLAFTFLPDRSEIEPPACGAPGVACLRVAVVRTFPHDRQRFTQGLEYHDGRLFEGTGSYGGSELFVSEFASGRLLARAGLPSRYFGEGLTLSGDRLLQLTWRERQVLIWDRDTLAPRGKVRYRGEGWGLCRAGDRLVMSNGSDRLTLRDPESFAATGTLAVTLAGRPVSSLNELECVDGQIYANVWPTDRIVRIDGATGAVTAVIDAAGLLAPADRPRTDVLNGIAWRPDAGTFLLTGKNWPYLYEVHFVPAR